MHGKRLMNFPAGGMAMHMDNLQQTAEQHFIFYYNSMYHTIINFCTLTAVDAIQKSSPSCPALMVSRKSYHLPWSSFFYFVFELCRILSRGTC